MLKKLLLMSALTTTSLFAYNVGDKLDNDVATKLNLQNDKIYILDFFASWCVSCKVELPLIAKLDESLNRTKYKIIGVDVDKDIHKGKNFVKKLNLKFDVIYDNDSQIISKFNPIGVPAVYYIKDLKVQRVMLGAVENIDQKIKNDLENLGE